MARFAASGKRSVVSVGNFDGLHLGHQQILRLVVERAQATGGIPGVVTFDPHPLKVLHPERAPALVETLQQRLDGFAGFGIEGALVLTFDRELAAVSAQDFVQHFMVETLRASEILVGENFRFGHKQEGNVTLLGEMGREAGFLVETVPAVLVGDQVVSSTSVRRAIAEGRVTDAARLLGRPFALTGEIARGAGRGSTILFPTLNLAAEQELLPKTGVYATEAIVGGAAYHAATNVGFRPTFNGSHVSIESHLFDFSEVLTQGRLEVRFWQRLRDERKFAGPAELKAQIAADLEHAREVFRELDRAALSTQRV